MSPSAPWMITFWGESFSPITTIIDGEVAPSPQAFGEAIDRAILRRRLGQTLVSLEGDIGLVIPHGKLKGIFDSFESLSYHLRDHASPDDSILDRVFHCHVKPKTEYARRRIQSECLPKDHGTSTLSGATQNQYDTPSWSREDRKNLHSPIGTIATTPSLASIKDAAVALAERTATLSEPAGRNSSAAGVSREQHNMGNRAVEAEGASASNFVSNDIASKVTCETVPDHGEDTATSRDSPTLLGPASVPADPCSLAGAKQEYIINITSPTVLRVRITKRHAGVPEETLVQEWSRRLNSAFRKDQEFSVYVRHDEGNLITWDEWVRAEASSSKEMGPKKINVESRPLSAGIWKREIGKLRAPTLGSRPSQKGSDDPPKRAQASGPLLESKSDNYEAKNTRSIADAQTTPRLAHADGADPLKSSPVPSAPSTPHPVAASAARPEVTTPTYIAELLGHPGNTTASTRLLRILRDESVKLDTSLGLKLLDLARALRADGELAPPIASTWTLPPPPSPIRQCMSDDDQRSIAESAIEPIKDKLNDFAEMLNVIAEAVGVDLLPYGDEKDDASAATEKAGGNEDVPVTEFKEISSCGIEVPLLGVQEPVDHTEELPLESLFAPAWEHALDQPQPVGRSACANCPPECHDPSTASVPVPALADCPVKTGSIEPEATAAPGPGWTPTPGIGISSDRSVPHALSERPACPSTLPITAPYPAHYHFSPSSVPHATSTQRWHHIQLQLHRYRQLAQQQQSQQLVQQRAFQLTQQPSAPPSTYSHPPSLSQTWMSGYGSPSTISFVPAYPSGSAAMGTGAFYPQDIASSGTTSSRRPMPPMYPGATCSMGPEPLWQAWP